MAKGSNAARSTRFCLPLPPVTALRPPSAQGTEHTDGIWGLGKRGAGFIYPGDCNSFLEKTDLRQTRAGQLAFFTQQAVTAR